ncbi:hypothetical protein AB0J86_00180 [Micromonospora sp. NPDC049559]|uniref:hypothetical protein n=1 Tax=Micromonospora sp. NPDC049559 TaxID=3155923 RepID=UPI00344678A5
MSRDVIALLPAAPDVPAMLAAMAAAGEELLVLPAAGRAVLQLCDAADPEHVRPLLSIEEPLMVTVPGEVTRLLGAEVGVEVPTPVWWVEARAAATPERAVRLAYRFAGALVRRLGGVVWPPPPAPHPHPRPPI